MNVRKTLLLLAATALLLASCAAPAPPPPQVTPTGEDRYLIDPRTNATETLAPAVATRIDAAWRYILAGDYGQAETQLAQVRMKAPDSLQLALEEAAIAIRQGRFDEARTLVAQVRERDRENVVARVYEAEIAMRQGQTRAALDIYRDLGSAGVAIPTVQERVTELSSSLFQQLYSSAQTAPDAEAVRLLREALVINPAASDARIALAQRLLTMRQFDEARRELEPIVNGADADRNDVQEMLAEIEVGRGRFQEAIVRYDRLARRTKDERYTRRLNELKEQWSAENMPPQYRRAFESESINRADFAVLVYWKVASVRFGQALRTPPIATDISDVAGREEIIRALAIGLYDVDPVTREVLPYRTVNAERLTRYGAQLLTIRGASCVGKTPAEANATARAEKVLAACGVTDPLAGTTPDAPVTGRAAAAMLEQIDRAIGQ